MLRAPSTYSLTLSNTASVYGDENDADMAPQVAQQQEVTTQRVASSSTTTTTMTPTNATTTIANAETGMNRSNSFFGRMRTGSFQVKKPELKIVDSMAQEDLVHMEIRVSDPKQVPQSNGQRRASTSVIKSFLNRKETQYAVTTTTRLGGSSSSCVVVTVERSFKDFISLRLILSRRFPGACVPPLPQTKKMGAKTDPFVRKRMRMLELFSQTLADHVFFRNDDACISFFTSQVEFESSSGRLPDVSEGVERWRQAIAAAPRPRKFVELCDAVLGELKASQRALLAVKAAAKVEAQRGVARVDATRDLADALDRWTCVERATESPLAGSIRVEVFDEQDNRHSRSIDASLPEALGFLASRTADLAAATRIKYGETQLEETILDAARFELASINVWIDAVELARGAERRAKSALAEVTAAQSTATGHLPGSASALAVATRVAEIKDGAQFAQDELTTLERGLMCVELLRFRQARVLRALRLKESLMEMHRTGAFVLLEAWGISFPQQQLPIYHQPVVVEVPQQQQPASTLESDVLKAANEALAATRAVAESLQAPVMMMPPTSPPAVMGLSPEQVEELVTKRFWVLAYTLFFLQMLLAMVFLVRGYTTQSLSVGSVSFVTLGTAHAVHLAYPTTKQ